jgi:adenosine tuberculosinyltransferase
VMIDSQAFENLTVEEAAEVVESHGPLVGVFPINGTRRWYLLKVLAGEVDGKEESYLHVMEYRHIDMYRMFFDQGVHTLLTPIFGADLLERGDDYIQMAIHGIGRLVSEPHFLEFYNRYQVRVRFYGDYRRRLANTPYEYLLEKIDQITEQTKSYSRNRLFFGMFGNDATEQVAELSVRYFQEHHCVPDRKTLVTLYYGEYVDPVNFFIGFDRFSAFDMPLLATGEEDLYFTISPSLDLSVRQLRQILYDHLYTRRTSEPDYETLPSVELEWMQRFYTANQERTLGVGVLKGGIWYPVPAEEWPTNNTPNSGEHR